MDDNNNDDDEDSKNTNTRLLIHMFLELSKALNVMTDRRLEKARDTLEQLLNAGEIKKLDALIGQSAREEKLDVAFFQVLQMNLRDAATADVIPAGKEVETTSATTTATEDNPPPKDANRYQILQHIYTRCQEEVEKTINPGTALLNKVLRTDVDSIRTNQLNHYLCPASDTIRSPEGKEIHLTANTNKKPLVPHQDFCKAIGTAVKQIRTVEKSGALGEGEGSNTIIAANLVESIRKIAIEARIVIGEHYGRNSTELTSYEESLEPIFRPTSPDSPYIQGEWKLGGEKIEETKNDAPAS